MPGHVKARTAQDEQEERQVRKLARGHHAPVCGPCAPRLHPVGVVLSRFWAWLCFLLYTHTSTSYFNINEERNSSRVAIVTPFCPTMKTPQATSHLA
jgi:hypothetical protein